MNGSCWQYSVYCAQWGLCVDDISPTWTAKREAEYYRTGIFGIMKTNYTELVDTGVISEASLCYHYLRTSEVNETTRGLVHDEITRSATQPCDQTIHSRYWTGTDSIRVTALWLRQPLLVVDMNTAGPITAQLHVLAKLTTDVNDKRETVRTIILSHTQLVEWLEAYRAARVIPLVVELDHSSKHFTGLRVEEQRYHDHALVPKARAAMKKRLRTMLKARGQYGPPALPPKPLLAARLITEDSATSLYSSSPASESKASTTLHVPIRGRGAREMIRLATDVADPETDASDLSSTALVVWAHEHNSVDEETKSNATFMPDENNHRRRYSSTYSPRTPESSYSTAEVPTTAFPLLGMDIGQDDAQHVVGGIAGHVLR